jgi:hypothetical protein
MPYIHPDRRAQVRVTGATSSGELNYEITAIVNDYLNAKGLSYSVINDIMGALEGAKVEFYRRVAVPYEDEKIHINGDVYPVKRV